MKSPQPVRLLSIALLWIALAATSAGTVPAESGDLVFTPAVATTSSQCGVTDDAPLWVQIVVDDVEPRPTEYCNCDTDEECKAICGPAGGTCGIFMACPIPPYKHVGTCFCNRTPSDVDGHAGG